MAHRDFIASAGRRIAAALLALCVALSGAASAQDGAADRYRLQPGDQLRMIVVGVPELDADASIDIDGFVVLPQVGRIPAADRTIEDIEREVRNRIAGQAAKRYSSDGAPVFIPLNASDVALSVLGYRPVYVSGDVRAPGQVAFAPSLTVRAAMAMAGGASTVSALGVSAEEAARRAPRLQAEYQRLSLEYAALTAELWRIEAALAKDADRAPPSEALPVSPEVFANMIESQRRQLRADLELLETERRFLETAIAESDKRRDVLERQSVQQQEMVEYDESEFERVRDALQRGVIQIQRVQDSRRDLNSSSTRLLDTENNLLRVSIERNNYERQLAGLEDDREARLLAERDEVRRDLLETLARLEGARGELEVNGLSPTTDAGEEDLLIVIYRTRSGVLTSFDAVLDTPVRPGDVIEVTMLDPAIAIFAP